ncbi:SDR family NAD(P)-dependent oxidoreductase [Aeromicrobium sp. Leaf350]|uniref:SDR family NAD(P)-dependent oxidoreductase n=1 Tax=Aeromicrobium sp. Leaf350 TaxID=2876565 RepID=UPI001E57319F|nr:SDR family oxidoreductase [Aeromicrobium sp. Leaf350]
MTRIALITGGNRGLGRAAALSLAADGTDVVLTYRGGSEEASAVVAEVEALGRRAAALQLDTTVPSGFAAFAEALTSTLREVFDRETFDVLVNNAGYSGWTPFGETTEAQLDDLLAVHVKGPILLTELLAPLVVDGGRVLFVSTGLTRFVATPAYSAYASAKGAIEVYTTYAAKALGSRGITVNVVAPGATATDFGGGMIRDNDDYRAMITANHAFGRVGEPEDIGGAIRALASESAGWITGQRVEASGGQAL